MFFKSRNPDKLVRQMIDEAKAARHEHRAAAEFNCAMADMLDGRIARLQAELAPTLTDVVSLSEARNG